MRKCENVRLVTSGDLWEQLVDAIFNVLILIPFLCLFGVCSLIMLLEVYLSQVNIGSRFYIAFAAFGFFVVLLAISIAWIRAIAFTFFDGALPVKFKEGEESFNLRVNPPKNVKMEGIQEFHWGMNVYPCSLSDLVKECSRKFYWPLEKIVFSLLFDRREKAELSRFCKNVEPGTLIVVYREFGEISEKNFEGVLSIVSAVMLSSDDKRWTILLPDGVKILPQIEDVPYICDSEANNAKFERRENFVVVLIVGLSLLYIGGMYLELSLVLIVATAFSFKFFGWTTEYISILMLRHLPRIGG